MAVNRTRDRGEPNGRRWPIKDGSTRYMRHSAALPRLGEAAEHAVIRSMEHLRRARGR